MDNLEELAKMFSEFLTLYKFVNKKTIIQTLQSELTSNQLIEIYRLTDGEHSTRDIVSLLTEKCGHDKVARLWRQWALKGLVVAAERKGRVKAAFNLDEYGITQVDEED